MLYNYIWKDTMSLCTKETGLRLKFFEMVISHNFK